MFALNYAEDIDGMSEEAQELARRGVVILKCYQAMKGIHLKVTTRLEFDETCGLVDWYCAARGIGRVVNINIGDYVHKGDLLFTIVG